MGEENRGGKMVEVAGSEELSSGVELPLINGCRGCQKEFHVVLGPPVEKIFSLDPFMATPFFLATSWKSERRSFLQPCALVMLALWFRQDRNPLWFRS